MNSFSFDDPSTKRCSAYLNKCSFDGQELITFNYGSSLDIVYPKLSTGEKCGGHYQIQGLSRNIKRVSVRCTSYCNVRFDTSDLTFTLRESCAKYHATQITVEIDISRQITVPYFFKLDRILLNSMQEGDGDSHIIQLKNYEFLTFKCTITKTLGRFEVYIENLVYTVNINGFPRSFRANLKNINDDPSEWYTLQLDFTFNPDVVRQEFIEMSEDSAARFFASSNTGSSRATAPPATDAAEEAGEDLQFFDANCADCLNWDCERHISQKSTSERQDIEDEDWSSKALVEKYDKNGDEEDADWDFERDITARPRSGWKNVENKVWLAPNDIDDDGKWTDKNQILDIYEKEKSPVEKLSTEVVDDWGKGKPDESRQNQRQLELKKLTKYKSEKRLSKLQSAESISPDSLKNTSIKDTKSQTTFTSGYVKSGEKLELKNEESKNSVAKNNDKSGEKKTVERQPRKQRKPVFTMESFQKALAEITFVDPVASKSTTTVASTTPKLQSINLSPKKDTVLPPPLPKSSSHSPTISSSSAPTSKKPNPPQTSNFKPPQQSDKDLQQLVTTLTQKQEFFKKILNQTKYTDVVLINSKGEEVPAFRCFLAHSSPVFEAIFDSKEELPIRIEVGVFEKETMKQAVYFSQGDLITVTGNSMDLFKFAKKFGMGILMDCCFSSLTQTITTKNICEYIKFAYEEENDALKKKCLEFLKENKLAVDPIKIKELPQEILFDAFFS